VLSLVSIAGKYHAMSMHNPPHPGESLREDVLPAIGLSNMHGLRHRYAQMRHEVLTGWKAPAAGGPDKAQLSSSQRMSDQHARQQISHELGHERLKVTSIYLGT